MNKLNFSDLEILATEDSEQVIDENQAKNDVYFAIPVVRCVIDGKVLLVEQRPI